MNPTFILENLVVRLIGDATNFNLMMQNVERRMEFLAKKMMFMGGGGMGAAAIGLPISILTGLWIRSFAQLDAAVTKSMTLMKQFSDRNTTVSFRGVARTEIEDRLMGLAAGSPIPVREFGSALDPLARTGLSAAAAIQHLAVAERFAVATSSDLIASTNKLVDVQGAFHLRSTDTNENLKNFAHITEVVTDITTRANVHSEELLDSLTRIGPISHSLGMSLEDVAGVLRAYAEEGLKGGQVTRQLRTLMLGLQEDAAKHPAIWKDMGVWIFDAHGKMKPFAEVVQILHDRIATGSAETKAFSANLLGLSTQTLRGLEPIINSAKAIKEWSSEMKYVNVVAEMARHNMESFSALLEITRNRITVMGIGIAIMLLPYMVDLVHAVTRLIEWWDRMNPAVRQVIVNIFAAGAAIAGFLAIARFGFSALRFILAPIEIVLGLIGVVFAAISPVTLALLTAIAGIAIAMGKEGIAGMWTRMKSNLQDFATFAAGFMANFTENWKILTEWVGSHWTELLDALSVNMGVLAKNISSNLLVGFVTGFEAISTFLRKNMVTILNNVGAFIVNIFTGIMPTLGKYGLAFIHTMGEEFKYAFSWKSLTFQKQEPLADFSTRFGQELNWLEEKEEAIRSVTGKGAFDNLGLHTKSLQSLTGEEWDKIRQNWKSGIVNPMLGMRGITLPPFNTYIPPDPRNLAMAGVAGRVGLGASPGFGALGALASTDILQSTIQKAIKGGHDDTEKPTDVFPMHSEAMYKQFNEHFKEYNLNRLALTGPGGLAQYVPPRAFEVEDKKAVQQLILLNEKIQRDKGIPAAPY